MSNKQQQQRIKEKLYGKKPNPAPARVAFNHSMSAHVPVAIDFEVGRPRGYAKP